MKIAIHERKGSFSDRWIDYCQTNSIPYKIVNCYDNDIIPQLSDCGGLMWHWQHYDPKAILFAKQLTYSIEKMGKKVFPSSNTSWHFDDKIGQKYLLEAIDAPIIPTYIFYSKDQALKWIDKTVFPKVFKLRKGASSLNVELIKNQKQAKKYVRKAFSIGFNYSSRVARIKDDFRKFKIDKNSYNFQRLMKGIVRLAFPKNFEKYFPKEKGYIYFQNFVPNNDFDTRVTVIGNRCVSVRRYNRENDFRASGSNILSFDPKDADLSSIKIAFKLSQKLNFQSMGYDFIYNNRKSEIVEMSYAFPMGKVGNYPGYWDQNLDWHMEEVNLQYYMVEDFINELLKKKIDHKNITENIELF